MTASGNGDWSAQVGGRLREARRQLGWSLRQAAAESNGRFKATSLGMYERGDRQLTIGVLYDLAALYRSPLLKLLPRPPAVGETTSDEQILERLASLPLNRRAAVVALIEQLADDSIGTC